eukprot:383512-Prymnesium_polylepis.1
MYLVVRCGGVQSPPGASLADAGLSPPGGGRSAGVRPPCPSVKNLQRCTRPHSGALGAPTHILVLQYSFPRCLAALCV